MVCAVGCRDANAVNSTTKLLVMDFMDRVEM